MAEVIDLEDYKDKKLEEWALKAQGLDPKKYGCIIIKSYKDKQKCL